MPQKKGKDARSEGQFSIRLKLVEDTNTSYERVLDLLASILIENAENDGTITTTAATAVANAA